uniref:mucin-binding protein n=3 Tax=Levilactobacillus brevis TaxID=1580 RepID=UPI000B34E682
SFFVFGGVSTVAVHADTTSGNLTAATVNSTSDTKSAAQSAATAASSASDTKSAAQSAATAASSASDTKSAAQSAATTVSSASDTKSAAQSATTAASSAAKAETTSASSSSAAKSDTTSVASSSAVKADSTGASSSATKADVDKDNFLEYFSLNGSATYDAKTGIVTITPDQNNQVGNFSLTSKIDMNKRFTLTGQVNLGSNPNGADGIGFAFHSGNTTDVGNAGGNLGIGGLQDAIGFKLDTYFNPYQAPLSNKNGSEISSTDSDGFGWNRDSAEAPYGTFVKTSNQEISTTQGSKAPRWWAQDTGTSQALSKADIDGHFHNFVVNYDGAARTLTVSYTQASGKVLTWTTTVASSYQVMAMVVSASTGAAKNLQQFELTSFDFQQAATVNVKYVDTTGHNLAQRTVNYPDGANVNGRYTTEQLAIPNYRFIKMDDKSLDANGTLTHAGDNGTVIYVYAPNQEAAKVTYIDDPTGKKLITKDLTGNYGTTDSYRTADSIKGYDNQGYELVSDNYPATGVVYDQDGVVKSYEVHLTHGTTQTSGNQTVNETIHYQGAGNQTPADQTAQVTFTRQGSTDAVTGATTYGPWSADQSFAAVTSPAIKGYTADQAQIDTITGITADSANVEKTVTYTPNVEKANVTYIDDTTGKTGKKLITKDLTGNYGTTDSYRTADSIKGYDNQGYELVSDNYPATGVVYDQDGVVKSYAVHLTHGTTQTSENQTVNETIHYQGAGNQTPADQTAQVTFTRQGSTDAVTGATTYGPWSADQSFAAVTSPAIKGYTPDQAEIGTQTVTGDSSDLAFKVTYKKDAPTVTTESKTVNETIHYSYKDGTTAHDDYVATPVEFTRQVSTDAVTGEKTYRSWSADQSFAAVTSPELKGYTADKAQIDKQTVNGDSKDLEFTVTYTKTPVAGGNVTAKYVDENGNPIADDVIASGNVGDPYSTTQKDVPGYTFKEVQGNPTGSFTDQDQTVTYVYTKNPAIDNNGGTGLNQPGKPGNGTDTGNPSSNQPGNPSQPSNATNNGVINTSTNTGSKVNNGAVNSPELPQTGENNSQSQTMSFIGILLAMFGSLLGFLGIKKRRND